jgi:hypothetical protein
LNFTVTTPSTYKITGLLQTTGPAEGLAMWALYPPDTGTYPYGEQEWTTTTPDGTFSPDGLITGDEGYTAGSPSGTISPGTYRMLFTLRIRSLAADSVPTSVEDAWAKLEIQPLVMPVDIDIKPGSYPNAVNNDGNGVIPVAILGSTDFDVTLIAPETVALDGMPVKTVGKANKLQAHYEDVNGDDFQDLVVQIQDVQGTFAEGAIEATLTGQLTDGTPIEGADEITLVP